MTESLVRSARAVEGRPQGGYCRVVKDTVYHFWQSTSLVALGHSYHSRHFLPRLLWMAFFIFGMYRSFVDVLNVYNTYKLQPYSTQMKSENKPRMNFPAITVCNQNRISCDKLLKLMLDKRQVNNTQDYENLEGLYLLSHCSPKTLDCNKVLDQYMEHIKVTRDFPKNLVTKDTCLDCETIISYWNKDCTKGGKNSPLYAFWWMKIECGKKLFNSVEDILMILKMNKLPTSLPECPQQPGGPNPPMEDNTESSSSSQTPSLTNSVGSSGDETLDEEGVSQGGSRTPTVLMNITDSTTDLDVNRTYLENGSFADINKSKDAVQSVIDELAPDAVQSVIDDLAPDAVQSVIDDLAPDAVQSVIDDLAPDAVQSVIDDLAPDAVQSVIDDLAPDAKATTDVTTNKVRSKRLAKPRPVDFMYRKNKMETSEQYDNKMNFLTTYMLLSDHLKKELGYTFEDLIIDCKIMGYICTNSSLFKNYYSPNYGNCYIFNYDGDHNMSLAGPTYSFSLVLNVHQESYLPDLLTDKAGARLAIHRPLTFPSLDNEATDVSSGTAYSIAIKEVEYTRLRGPFHSNCTEQWANTSYLPYTETNKINQQKVYSYATCLKLCVQRMFMDQCSCAHPLLPVSFTYAGNIYKDKRICNLTSIHEDNTCRANIFNTESSYLNDTSNCDCMLACSEKTYPKVVSSTSWPPGASKSSVELTYDLTHKMVEENLVVLDVFFQSLIADSVTEVAQYDDLTDLVSSVGGALSLYLGISVFLLLEFVEFFFSFIYNSLLYALGRYSFTHDKESSKQELIRSSVSPTPPQKGLPDISVTTTTTIGDLNNLRNVYGIDRLMEALTSPTRKDTSDNFRDYKSHVFDDAFHR